ncbi:MAG: hypothetical protein V4516_17110, partial [Pseudomonadota bacterium]
MAKQPPAVPAAAGDERVEITLADGRKIVLGKTHRIKGPLVFRPGNVRVQQGTLTPEAVVSAPVGSIFQRTDGDASSSVYVKKSGTSNTGWAPMAAVSSLTQSFLFSD